MMEGWRGAGGVRGKCSEAYGDASAEYDAKGFKGRAEVDHSKNGDYHSNDVR